MGRAIAPKIGPSGWRKYKSMLENNNISETSFIVVRHPFERIVSAFRDKLERSHAENYTTDFYYKKYGVEIVKKYRERALDTFGSHFFR